MKNVPNLIQAEDLKEWTMSREIKTENGSYWTPSRPMGYKGLDLINRVRLAWNVFMGRYDALSWKEQ